MRFSLLFLYLVGGIIPAFGRQSTGESELPRPGNAAPASIRFERLTADDGLSSQVMFTAIQDQRGFMWFGTWSGLNRYDGYSFTQYKHTPFDSTSIATNNIWSLYEDRSGVLWVGSALGAVSRFDPVTEEFTHFRDVPDDSTSLMLGGIWAMHEDRSGTLWVGRFDGLDRMNPETGAFTRYRHVPGDASSLSNNSVSDIHEDGSGALWVSTANGLNRRDPETGVWTRFLYEPHASGEPAQNPSYSLHVIYVDRREPGVLWIGSSQGLLRFDTASGEHERFLPDPQATGANSIREIAPDPDHPEVLWLATGGGLYRFDQRTGQFKGYHHDPGDPTSLSNDDLTDVYTDRTGIIWVCTSEHGVNKFDPAAAGVVHYQHVPGDSNSLPVNTIGGLYEDRAGTLWVGLYAEEGLARINRQTGQVTTWKLPTIKAILEDRSGTLWAGAGFGDGLYRLDPTTGSFVQYRYDPVRSGTFGANQTFRLLEDQAGVLWIGSLNGLKRRDPETGAFTRFDHNPEDPTSLSDNLVVSLYEDHSGALWVGTIRGGLNRMDRATGTFTRYQHDPRNPNSLSNNAVWSLLEREREPGVLWIGTDGGGLNRLDTRTGIFTHFTTDDGLVDNTVWGILEDERGRLWMSTPGGLSRFDPERGQFRNYTDNRLQSREFKDESYFKSRSGEMFFGGVNGFTAFFPADMRDNPHPPQVALTGLKLFNRPVQVGEDSPLRQPIWSAEEVRLAHDQNSISFDFVALHYRNPQQNQYAYRLEGFDKDWVQGSVQRTVTYTNLDPGEYVFRVKASNSDGVWNEQGASVRLVMLPPWWRTWWAYVLYGLLFVSAAVAAFRSQRNRLVRRERERARQRELQQAREIERAYHQLEEQAKLLVEMDRVKGRFFANISHEFRTPMTLLLAPLRDALESDEEPRLSRRQLALMHRNGERLLRLINQLLDLSRIEAGSMHLCAREADLVGFLRSAVLAFSSRAEHEQITLSFHSEEAQIPLYYDPEKLEKVLFNLLSNAIKFTAAGGKVRVSTARVDGEAATHALIVVKDTGQGIPSDKLPLVFDRFYQIDGSTTRRHEGTGIGLALAKELVELHGGTISAESEVGFGSTFTVRLPLGKQHLRPEDLAQQPCQDQETKLPDVEAYMIEETAVAEAPSDAEVPADAPVVVVVEDNADVRAYMRAQLGTRYRIEEAADGLDGLDVVRRVRPDLVISDVMMPRLDGFALCRMIKTDAKLSHIPVILLTAKADEESKIEGLTTGADDYLMKPFSAQELMVRAENLIEVRRLLRQRFSGEVRLGPSPVTVTSADAMLFERLHEVVEAHLGESAFGVERLADEVGLSTRQLHRRMKELTGLTSGGYIRMMRMERAAQLLQQRAGNISEVARAVGFNDASYFARLFSQSFGMTPSEFTALEK